MMFERPATDIVALIDNGKFFVQSETKDKWVEVSEVDFWKYLSNLTKQVKEEFEHVQV